MVTPSLQPCAVGMLLLRVVNGMQWAGHASRHDGGQGDGTIEHMTPLHWAANSTGALVYIVCFVSEFEEDSAT